MTRGDQSFISPTYASVDPTEARTVSVSCHAAIPPKRAGGIAKAKLPGVRGRKLKLKKTRLAAPVSVSHWLGAHREGRPTAESAAPTVLQIAFG